MAIEFSPENYGPGERGGCSSSPPRQLEAAEERSERVGGAGRRASERCMLPFVMHTRAMNERILHVSKNFRAPAAREFVS